MRAERSAVVQDDRGAQVVSGRGAAIAEKGGIWLLSGATLRCCLG